MKQFESEITIPSRVGTLHQLSYFLLREYVEEENYRYTNIGKFDVIFETANAYNVGIYSACKVTAKEVLERYKPSINSKNKQQLVFIISKHLETIVNKAKDN